MKRAGGVILLCFILAAGAADVRAAETALLGDVQIALKTGTLALGDSAGTTPYYGFEIYKSLTPNLYIGAEAGYMREKGFLDSLEMGRVENETTLIPVEINLKGVADLGSSVFAGLGGGISFNRVEYQATAISPFGPPGIPFLIQDISETRPGVQLFVELNVAFGPVFVGLSAKGQVIATGDKVNTSGTYSYDNFSNWRAGAQIGMRF